MAASAPASPARMRVCIVGAGVSGIAAAVNLKMKFGHLEESGLLEMVLYEKNASFGGTWFENTYPGAQCDVPSHFYCFSFAPNPSWSAYYSPQEEIRTYLEDTATRFGVRKHVRFNTEFVGAVWDDAGSYWRIQTRPAMQYASPGAADAAIVETVADILVVSAAALNRAAIPDFPGLPSFKGRVFHTSKWDHSFDARNKRVAVIGTGASSVQVVPAIAPDCAHLDVYQRTPGWSVPRKNYKYWAVVQWLLAHVPFLLLLYRAWLWLVRDLTFPAFKQGTFMSWYLRRLCVNHLNSQVADPKLRATLTPNYPPGCKRLLVVDDFFPALQKSNVSLITSGIERIMPTGIQTADGEHHPADAIVMATGFQVTSFLTHLNIVGKGGVKLSDRWRTADDIEAYYGTAISGLPNFFVLMGPNTALGHSSMIFIIETQVEWMCKILQERLRRNARAVDVPVESQKKYNAWLQQDLAGTVWASSCQSWYKTLSGKLVTLWPHSTLRFWWTLLWPRHHELHYA